MHPSSQERNKQRNQHDTGWQAQPDSGQAGFAGSPCFYNFCSAALPGRPGSGSIPQATYQSSPWYSTGCCVRPEPLPQASASVAQYLSHPQQIRSGCFGFKGKGFAIAPTSTSWLPPCATEAKPTLMQIKQTPRSTEPCQAGLPCPHQKATLQRRRERHGQSTFCAHSCKSPGACKFTAKAPQEAQAADNTTPNR